MRRLKTGRQMLFRTNFDQLRKSSAVRTKPRGKKRRLLSRIANVAPADAVVHHDANLAAWLEPNSLKELIVGFRGVNKFAVRECELSWRISAALQRCMHAG